MEDLSTHPAVVFIATASTLAGLVATIYGLLTYLRKRLVVPAISWFRKLNTSMNSLEEISKELKANGDGTLHDTIRRIETRLVVMEQKDRAFMMDHYYGIFICDEWGRTSWVNRTYCDLLKVTEEEIKGLNWKNFLHAEDRQGYVADWNDAVKDKREFSREVRLLSSDRVSIPVRIRAYPMEGRHHKVLGFIGMVEKAKQDANPPS